MKSKITQRGKLKLNRCLPVVCAFFAVTPRDILSKSRKNNIIVARHALRYYLAKGGELLFAEIGSLTNGDHSSVSHSINKFKVFSDTDYKYKQFLAHINGDPFKFENSITRLDEQLRKTETYNTLPLGAKIDFLKNFIEHNGY